MNQQFNWRAHLQVHPAAELFPLLSEAELEELASDIAKNGLRAPIVGWALDGQFLLDGRNRLDALALLGLLYEIDDHHVGVKKWTGERWSDRSGGRLESECEFQNFYDGDPYAIALSLNVHRRHLTPDQKRELIAKVLKAKPEQSNNSVAKQVKADDKTVAKVRRDLESTSEIPKLEKTVGTDGRARPATKPVHTKPKSSPAVNSRDVALESFDAHVLELLRLMKGQKPQRFAKTAVPTPLLGDLTHYLRELVNVRKLASEAVS
jgi:hypothetical protein